MILGRNITSQSCNFHLLVHLYSIQSAFACSIGATVMSHCLVCLVFCIMSCFVLLVCLFVFYSFLCSVLCLLYQVLFILLWYLKSLIFDLVIHFLVYFTVIVWKSVRCHCVQCFVFLIITSCFKSHSPSSSCFTPWLPAVVWFSPAYHCLDHPWLVSQVFPHLQVEIVLASLCLLSSLHFKGSG